MLMTVIVTRNVSQRIRGFLASSMLELAPGVYSSPALSTAVRDRIWAVLTDWFAAEGDASIVLIYGDPTQPGRQNVKRLGLPPIAIDEIDGLLVTCRHKA